MLQKQADLTLSIYKKRRAMAKYYIVVFSGAVYPPQVQGRVFILRGSVEERIGEFEQRLQKRWPGCWKEPFQDALGRIGASDESRTDYLVTSLTTGSGAGNSSLDPSVRVRKAGISRQDLAYGLLSTEPSQLPLRRRIELALALIERNPNERDSETELLEASQQLILGGAASLGPGSPPIQQHAFKMAVRARVP